MARAFSLWCSGPATSRSMRPEDTEEDAWGVGSLAAWTEAADHQLTTFDRPSMRYVPGGELGRGGMGVVSMVHDIWLGREVALKRPLPSAPDSVRRRAMREAAITARLLHPSIVPIFDVGEDEEGPFYTMPVLIGMGLDESILEEHRTVDAHVRVLIKVAFALGYAHKHGYIHRDVKPANILVGVHGEVWVLDWGVAFDPFHPSHLPVGTPGFAAPEQVRGETVAPMADVYSLGCCLTSVLGKHEAAYPALRAIRDHAVQVDYRKRYPDGTAFAEELERWAEGQRVLVHDYSLVELLWHWAKRRRAPLTVALVALFIGMVGLWGSLDAQQEERQRADRAFAATLSQQAMALVRQHGWAEARVLASHALSLADTPASRGVLMALGDGPRVEQVSARQSPCEARGWLEDGAIWCGGTTVVGPDGASQTWELPALPDPTRIVRLTVDGVVLRAGDANIGWWSKGADTVSWFDDVHEVRAASGPTSAWFSTDRVGWLDERGEVRWTEPLCERISAVWVAAPDLAVGCRDGEVRIGTLEAPGDPIVLDDEVSAVTLQDGGVFGTFGGRLLTVRDGQVSAAVDSGVGVPVELVPTVGGQVVVRGERGRARVWSAEHQAFLATLPGRVGPVRADADGSLVSIGDEIRTWSTTRMGPPIVLDRSSQGGLAFASLSPSANHLLIGSGSGEVGVYELATGGFTVLAERAEASAKAGDFLDEETVVFSSFPIPPYRTSWRTGETRGDALPSARSATTWGEDGLLFVGWSSAVFRVTADALQTFELAAPIVHSLGPEPLLVDGTRTLYRIDRSGVPSPAFPLPFGPRCVAGSLERVFASDQDSVVALNAEGQVLWTVRRGATVTAMHQEGEWLAVGDGLGRVAVYDLDGHLLADVPAHTRLVSQVLIRGDQLITASWDGLIRRMSLHVLEKSVPELLMAAQAGIPLTLEEAIATAND